MSRSSGKKIKQFTHKEYDALENAITRGQKIAVMRRGTEYVVVPRRLRLENGREAIDATHPTTGESITVYIDEIGGFEVVSRR